MIVITNREESDPRTTDPPLCRPLPDPAPDTLLQTFLLPDPIFATTAAQTPPRVSHLLFNPDHPSTKTITSHLRPLPRPHPDTLRRPFPAPTSPQNNPHQDSDLPDPHQQTPFPGPPRDPHQTPFLQDQPTATGNTAPTTLTLLGPPAQETLPDPHPPGHSPDTLHQTSPPGPGHPPRHLPDPRPESPSQTPHPDTLPRPPSQDLFTPRTPFPDPLSQCFHF
nr:extensin-like [Salvelinus alpinus]